MKTDNCGKINRIIGLATFMLVATSVMVSCQGAQQIVRNAQDDVTAPVFLNLVFPFSGVVPEEGLLITGTLLDDTALSPTEPIKLEINMLGQNGIISTRNFTVCGEPYWQQYDTYFDNSTGNFQIKFWNHNRLKNGLYNFRLYGKDASGNMMVATTTANVLPINGMNPEAVHQARNHYGIQMKNLIDNYVAVLRNYPLQYRYDIAVLTRISQYYQDTYILSPHIDTWPQKAAAMVSDIQAIPNLSDPVTKTAVDTVVLPTFMQDLNDNLAMADNLYYPWEDDATILALWQEKVDRLNNFNVISVLSFPPTVAQYQDVTCHVIISGIPAWRNDINGIENFADFTMTASYSNPLSITGIIGEGAHRLQITPDGYVPPIKLAQYFDWTGLSSNYDMLLF